MYCYKWMSPYNPSAVFHIWDTVLVSVATGVGAPPSVQLFLLEEDGTLGSADPPHGVNLTLSAFGESCVEAKVIDSEASTRPAEVYVLTVRHKIKLRYLALLLIGLVLFFNAPSASRLATPFLDWFQSHAHFSRNVGMYYSLSVLLGVVMSLLLLLYVFSRMIPKVWDVVYGCGLQYIYVCLCVCNYAWSLNVGCCTCMSHVYL